MSTPRAPKVWMVVPCGGSKIDTAAPARDLYTGSLFRHQLASAEREAAFTAAELGVECEVLILSALHGLVTPDMVLAPYNVKMGDAEAVTVADLAESAEAAGIEYGDEVYGFLPKAYRAALAAALDVDLCVPLQDVYEATGGNGDQRGVCSSLKRTEASCTAELARTAAA